jgi:hypothetical protein
MNERRGLPLPSRPPAYGFMESRLRHLPTSSTGTTTNIPQLFVSVDREVVALGHATTRR